MKKLFYLILFFVLAGCSSNEESKSMDTSATINSATNIESLGNNIEQNQSEKKSSILIQESDSEDIIRDDSKPIVLAQTNLLSKKDWEFKESEHFMRLVPAQPTIGGPDKIEVTEFF